MSSFSVTGLTSGIDYASMVKAMVNASSQSVNMLKQKKTDAETILDLYDQLNTKLLSLESVANDLNLSYELVSRKASSSDTTKLTATATGSASTGSHTVKIGQLAQVEVETHSGAASLTTAVNSSGGDLVLQYTYAGTQRSLTISNNTTLEGLRDQLNNDTSNPGVVATILNDGSGGSTAYHLVLSGEDTGAGKYITIDSGTTLNGTSSVDFRSSAFTQTQRARSAVIGVDGYQTTFQAEIRTHSGSGVTDGTTVVNSSGSDKLFSLKYGDTTFNITVASGTTLNGLVTAINNAVDGRVTASVYNTNQLRLTGNDSALAITIQSTTTLDGTSSTIDLGSSTFSATQSAGGIASSSNSVTGVINGVTLDLVGTTSTDVTLTITSDTDAIKDKINSLVTAYNDVMSFIYEQTKYDANTRVAGPLIGEGMVRIIQDKLRTIVTLAVSGLSGTYTALSEIGIKTQKDWTLTVDDTTLSNSLSSNLSNVVDVITKNSVTGTSGVAEQLRTNLLNMNSIVDGQVHNRTKSLGDLLTDLSSQIKIKEKQLDKYEADLTRKFAALESLISGFSARGNYLSSQAAAWQRK